VKEQDLLYKLGQRIKNIREEKGITQVELGIEIEMEKSNVSRLESGRISPTFITLYRVAKALDISLSELVNIDQ
jgi:transcriptional regulator with XRE-family HTH domain